jgi:hypothetical protein
LIFRAKEAPRDSRMDIIGVVGDRIDQIEDMMGKMEDLVG